MIKLKINQVWLRKMNIILAVLYALQAVVVVSIAASDRAMQAISGSFLAIDKLASDAGGATVYQPASQHLIDINIVYVIAAVLLVAAIGHALLATRLSKRYQAELRKNTNSVRWVVLAVTTALIVEIIALLSGVNDIFALKTLAALSAIGALVWLVSEVYNQAAKRPHWPTFWIGVAAWLVPWLVLGTHIWTAATYGDGLPVYVIFLIASTFVVLAGLAVAFYLTLIRYRWFKKYVQTEAIMAIGLFVAISAMTWQIFAGTLMP